MRKNINNAIKQGLFQKILVNLQLECLLTKTLYKHDNGLKTLFLKL